MPRIAAAQLSHETNRFSAVRTGLDAFRASGLAFGQEILPAARGTNSSFGGFVAGAEEQGFELFPILSVWATPSGLVTREAFETLTGALIEGLRAVAPLDGVLLALHGAMVTEEYDDADGEILRRVRAAVGVETPVAVTLDLHANISEAMVTHTDLLIGYDTYPHVDMAERAREACALLPRLVRGEVRPMAALRKPPMLPTSQRMTTDRDPMRGLIARARKLEADPRVLNVTVTGGFPPADVAEAGFSVVVTTDGDADLATHLADELAAAAWAAREGFLGGVSSWAEAAEAVAEAQRGGGAEIGTTTDRPTAPLLLVDIGDNPWTGGPGDSAEIVRFLLAERVRGAAVALVADAEAAARCHAAGEGAKVELILGGKTDRLHGEPLPVRGFVRRLSDGRYVNQGPMMAGVAVDLGPSALLACLPPELADAAEDPGEAAVTVLVTSRAETPIDLNAFRVVGVEPTELRVIGLKGKGHFRAAFEPIASRVILVEGPGITGADLSRLPLSRVRRPIWPLDPV
jgi:microcystin degradation protein MlrC